MAMEQIYRRIIQIVAIFDMCLAVCATSYISYQFSHGENLIPGGLKRGEKISRLAVYAVLNYIFLMIQLVMAISLLYSSSKVLKDPTIQALQIFSRWRAWSMIYVMFLIIDVLVVALLMDYNKRKIISLVILSTQIIFRPIGIILIRQFEQICLILYDTSNTIIPLPSPQSTL